jgi:hypothetical protein
MAIFKTALRVMRIMGSLLIFAQSLSARAKNSPGNRSAVCASLVLAFFRIATQPPAARITMLPVDRQCSAMYTNATQSN